MFRLLLLFKNYRFGFRAVIIFGLNALNGRIPQSDGSLVGPWNYSNAASFIHYTVDKGYTIHGWELGNYLIYRNQKLYNEVVESEIVFFFTIFGYKTVFSICR